MEELPTEKLLTLAPKQQRFIHLYSTGQYSNAQIAKLLEVHPNTILSWVKRKDVQAALAELQEGTHVLVANQLKNLTMKATEKLNQLVDSPIDGVALQAVKDILDRAGHKPKQEIKVDKTVITVEEKLKSLVDSVVIDVDFEEVE